MGISHGLVGGTHGKFPRGNSHRMGRDTTLEISNIQNILLYHHPAFVRIINYPIITLLKDNYCEQNVTHFLRINHQPPEQGFDSSIFVILQNPFHLVLHRKPPFQIDVLLN